MAELQLLTALRAESVAVGGADTVLGKGPHRAQRAAAALSERLAAGTAVALVGVAGGLAAHVSTGDLVVPSTLRTADADVSVHLPASALLTAELRRSRATVHTGGLVSSTSFVRLAERERLTATGAEAVDMESAWVASTLQDEHPVVVVRAISDTAERSPVLGGLAALRALRTVREPLVRWARALGPREVLLASPRSFCAGVERAIEIVERAIIQFGAPVYVRRQIVHNLHVVTNLESRGAVFVQELDEVPPGSVVVFAAHGVSPEVRRVAVERGDLTVIDATCPLVAKVHAEARRFASRGYSLVLIGHADHEEVVGTVGESPGRFHVVADTDDVGRLELDDDAPVAVLTQTTLATDEAAVVIDALRSRFRSIESPPADDICYATQNRQDAVRAIARRCDLLLVVGSQNSSNTLRLVELAQREGVRAELVEDASEVRLEWLAGAHTIGLSAGASVPEALVDGVLEALRGLGPVRISEERVAEENVRFALPGRVR
ncbi:MAG TPA: 4-hydroxy-3-methylbut-2-enyl diphosphate reductase [Acidimicrobiales bacterium]|nr:4-hydroxy-3-methylbut-2-enyl diphosphate reductase [Acidimicrobiales bacterium]